MGACGYRMNMNMKTVENKAKNNSGELTDKYPYNTSNYLLSFISHLSQMRLPFDESKDARKQERIK